jgi:bifunctional DNase/RNase
MASDKCSCPGCEKNVVVRSHPIWKRRLVHEAVYCEEHARAFLANYDAQKLAREGPPQRWGNAVGFEIELLVCDDRPDKPCQLFLREVGGIRRLDCAIGIFEAAALQRELERLSTPRPLTHRAMASVITALGGRLECVLVDKFLAAQRIYEAKLQIRYAAGAVVVDVRVSDAVVLAVICNVPVFVLEEVARLAEQEHSRGM